MVQVCIEIGAVMLHIVALGWMYVVLMMSITEVSVVAGIMTFLMYGVVPLSIILYLMATPHRKRMRAIKEAARLEARRRAAVSGKGPLES
jgi:hypothetical protein